MTTIYDLPDTYAVTDGKTVTAYCNATVYGTYGTYEIWRRTLVERLRRKGYGNMPLTADPPYRVTERTIWINAAVTDWNTYDATMEAAKADAKAQADADAEYQAAGSLYRSQAETQSGNISDMMNRIADRSSISHRKPTPQPDPHRAEISDLIQRMKQ